ncbi:MAG: hypothetical protein ACPG8W_23730, partial [Candidatus Promineifilaceae bacterium]
MFYFRPISLLALLIPLLLACAPAPLPTATPLPEPSPTVIPTPTAESTAQPPTISLPMSIYILDDESGTLSSQRTIEEVEAIYERVNGIWSQATITLDVQTIERVTISNALLQAIIQGDFFAFFNAVNRGEIELPNLSLITGFYVQRLGGPNGINPLGSDIFFVMDTPSVHDERVTSHEIGHILGLHHV